MNTDDTLRQWENNRGEPSPAGLYVLGIAIAQLIDKQASRHTPDQFRRDAEAKASVQGTDELADAGINAPAARQTGRD